ncbi:hypothetical protein CGRA01v4_07022 [Colletotrichum graminicola]|nr:hypothetical protein CGRA01v4_07022 [Colletotrichum graminicola]
MTAPAATCITPETHLPMSALRTPAEGATERRGGGGAAAAAAAGEHQRVCQAGQVREERRVEGVEPTGKGIPSRLPVRFHQSRTRTGLAKTRYTGIPLLTACSFARHVSTEYRSYLRYLSWGPGDGVFAHWPRRGRPGGNLAMVPTCATYPLR